MKRKGFTLIELLAVIVILLVVSIITISVVGNILETSRENAFKDSVLSAFHAVEYYVVENELGDVPKEGIEVKSLKLKNNTFVSGRITKNEVNQLIAEFVSNGEYCAVGVMDHLTVSKGECEITIPTIEVSVEGKNANIKVTDEYGIIGYMITESSEEPSEWEEIEKVASIEEIKTAERAGTYYIHVKNKYGKVSVEEYNIEQSAFTSIITYIIGGTSIVREVTNGELVSDYVPTVENGSTFIGWTTNPSSTTAETIYVTGDMTVYGIVLVNGSASQNISYRIIDRYTDGDYTGSDGDTSFSVSSSVPLNTPITVSATFRGGNYFQGASVNVGGISLSASGFSDSSPYKSATKTGNLTSRSGHSVAWGYGGSDTMYVTINYSWSSYIIG